MIRTSTRLVLIPMCLVVGIPGCGSEAKRTFDRYEVSGTVTFRKQPLKWGTISFEPTSGDPLGAASADIVDGKYTISKSRGPEPGTYVVRISGGMNPADNALEAGPRTDDALPKDMVPPAHNEKSTLTREVKATDQNVFNFDLK